MLTMLKYLIFVKKYWTTSRIKCKNILAQWTLWRVINIVIWGWTYCFKHNNHSKLHFKEFLLRQQRHLLLENSTDLLTTFLLLLVSFAESAWFDSAFPEARDRRGTGVDSSSISGTGETSFSFCFFLAEFFEIFSCWSSSSRARI